MDISEQQPKKREDKEQGKLKRSIKARHLTMIAIGGSIGTGLFFASGSTISQVGPGGAILAFGLMGFIVYIMMQSLGEMATELPISGSFEAYADRFLDPAMGFAFGWNYWFAWAITVAAEFVAGAMLIKYWFPNASSSLLAMGFFVLLMGLNLISAKSFAESEYWFAGIKVVVIILFLIVGVLLVAGVIGTGPSQGFANWSLDGGAAGKAPFVGGFGMLVSVFLIVGFSFQGTELVGLAAAETENPQKNVPKAIKTVFVRMLLFYIGSILIIGTLIPFTDGRLLSGSIENIAESPFTIVFENAGFIAAASFLNAIILTSVLSCGNSGLFCASRMLYAMGTSGKAPKLFARVNKRGVPVYAVWATGIVGALSFFASMIGDGKIYIIFINASGITGFIIWFGIALCQFRFRKAWIAQGRKLEDLKFRSKFYPVGPIFAMVMFLVIIFGANIWVFQEEVFSWFEFITNYAFVPVFLGLYLGYKWKYKTKVVPLLECDFSMPEHEK